MKLSFQQWVEVIKLIILFLSGAAIPVTIAIIGNKLSNIKELEEKLRSDRIEIYNKILEPFWLIFSTEAVVRGSKKSKKGSVKTGAELAAEKILTIEYQSYSFQLSLIGADSVVKAYNNLMQAYYNLESENKGEDLISYMAVLLFEVRKSLGNKATKLHVLEMLEWKISDLRDKKIKNKYPNMEQYYN